MDPKSLSDVREPRDAAAERWLLLLVVLLNRFSVVASAPPLCRLPLEAVVLLVPDAALVPVPEAVEEDDWLDEELVLVLDEEEAEELELELLEALELELVDGVVETLAVGPWRIPRN